MRIKIEEESLLLLLLFWDLLSLVGFFLAENTLELGLFLFRVAIWSIRLAVQHPWPQERLGVYQRPWQAWATSPSSLRWAFLPASWLVSAPAAQRRRRQHWRRQQSGSHDEELGQSWQVLLGSSAALAELRDWLAGCLLCRRFKVEEKRENGKKGKRDPRHQNSSTPLPLPHFLSPNLIWTHTPSSYLGVFFGTWLPAFLVIFKHSKTFLLD